MEIRQTLQQATAALRPPVPTSKPVAPPSAATAAAPLPTAPPPSPDEIELSPLHVAEATRRVQREKYGQQLRAKRIWQQLNCDLEEDADGTWLYVIRPTCTEAPPTVAPSLDEVPVSAAELEPALVAMQQRVWGLQHQAYLLATQAAATPTPAETLTADRVWQWAWASAQHLAQQHRPAFAFALDAHNTVLFRLLCLYFARDPRFATRSVEWLGEAGEGMSLDKGICLLGAPGRGKTVLMRLFQQNPGRPFGLVSCRKVSDVFLEDMRQKESFTSQAQAKYRGVGGRPLCFDDAGREETRVMAMGNVVNPMATVILDRYVQFEAGRLAAWDTHFTSNNPLEPTAGQVSLTELYGAPAVDRIYQFCNIFNVSGESRRG